MAFLSHPGQSHIADYHWPAHPDGPSREKMQMDGAMGALNAVFELLVQNREDSNVIAVVPVIPNQWKTFSFKGILAEGAFLVSANVKDGITDRINIISKKGGELKLAHGLGHTYELNGKTISNADPILKYITRPGEVIRLKRIVTKR